MPMGFTTVLLLSDEVSQFVALICSTGGFVMAGYLLGNMTTVTLGRRQSFSLECSFQAVLQFAVEASRKADSILNHTLKNTMADAVGDIDMFLQKTAANIDVTHPRQAAAALRRGMRQCGHRQAYLQLAAHRYQVVLQPVDLKAFASELMPGRQVTLDLCELTVMLDVTLCSLILENALSNAFKHGCPQDRAVRLTITAASSNSATSSATEDNKVCVKFIVINRAKPTRPEITPGYVTKVLSDEVRRGSSTSPTSDHIGLQHSFLAAQAGGMTVSLTQTAEDVMFAGQIEPQTATSVTTVADEMREQDLAQFPNDLRICRIDDSSVWLTFWTVVFIKAFVPRRRQTAWPRTSKGVSVVRFFWPKAQSCLAWGLVLALCKGVGIGDSAQPAAPRRITTVGIPPAVGLRLVLMPLSLKCCSAANFFGLCFPPSLFSCRFLGLFSSCFCLCGRPQVVSLCRSNIALGVRPLRGLPQASGLVCSQLAERVPCERPHLL